MQPPREPPKAPRHRPPSRIRYEEQHPNIVTRVPLATFHRLQDVMKATGKSMSRVVRELLEPGLRDRGADYERGWSDGYRKAKQRFAITYRCLQCRGPMYVEFEDEKAGVSAFMESRGWHHEVCPPQSPSATG